MDVSTEPPTTDLVVGKQYDVFTASNVFERRFDVYRGRGTFAREIGDFKYFTDFVGPLPPVVRNGVVMFSVPNAQFRPYTRRQTAKELRTLEKEFENPNSRLRNFPVGPDSVLASYLTGEKGRSFQQQRFNVEKDIGMEGPAHKYGGRRRRKTGRRATRKTRASTRKNIRKH